MDKIIHEDNDERIIRSFRMECEYLNEGGGVPNTWGRGFCFDCDEKGNLDPGTSECGRQNFEACKTGQVDGQRVSELRLTHLDKSIRLCSCGSRLIPSRR